MTQRRTSLFIIPIFFALFSHGQFNPQTRRPTDTVNLVAHVRAVLKSIKAPENQSIHFSQMGIIYVFTYLDNTDNKDSLELAARNKSVEIYHHIKDGKVNKKKLRMEDLGVYNLYWNRHFMRYGKTFMSFCNVENGVVKNFHFGEAPVKSPGFINTALYQNLTTFKLNPNQFIAPHDTEKETLCLVNISSDIFKDWKKESEEEFKRFKSALKSISPYKRLMVRYQSKYNTDEKREYTYNFKERR